MALMIVPTDTVKISSAFNRPQYRVKAVLAKNGILTTLPPPIWGFDRGPI